MSSFTFGQKCPTMRRGLSATAELLVLMVKKGYEQNITGCRNTSCGLKKLHFACGTCLLLCRILTDITQHNIIYSFKTTLTSKPFALPQTEMNLENKLCNYLMLLQHLYKLQSNRYRHVFVYRVVCPLPVFPTCNIF